MGAMARLGEHCVFVVEEYICIGSSSVMTIKREFCIQFKLDKLVQCVNNGGFHLINIILKTY